MAGNKPINKLIFDNDGVNIDSEHVAMQVMDDYGYALVKRYAPDAALKPGDIYEEYPGNSTDRIVELLAENFGLPVDKIIEDYDVPAGENYAEFLADLITIETNQRFLTDLKAIPGITRSLTKLQGKYGAENIALCTTSRTDRMNVSLECAADADGNNAKLAEIFPEGPRRVSGYGFENKYSLYLENNPDWDPAASVVIEDSLSGVKKAKAASDDFRVVGTAAAGFYKDKDSHAKNLMAAGASIVVTDIADLPKAIEWLDNGLDPQQSPVFKASVYTPADIAAPSIESKGDQPKPVEPS